MKNEINDLKVAASILKNAANVAQELATYGSRGKNNRHVQEAMALVGDKLPKLIEALEAVATLQASQGSWKDLTYFAKDTASHALLGVGIKPSLTYSHDNMVTLKLHTFAYGYGLNGLSDAVPVEMNAEQCSEIVNLAAKLSMSVLARNEFFTKESLPKLKSSLEKIGVIGVAPEVAIEPSAPAQ
jgi:hypothetical protein